MNKMNEQILKKIKRILVCVLAFLRSRAGIGITVLLLLLLVVSLVIGSCVGSDSEDETTTDTESVSETTTFEPVESTEDTTAEAPAAETKRAIDNMEIPDTNWAYFLINRSNPVKDNFEDTIDLDYVYSNGTKYLLDSRITGFTEAMINDAYDDGVTLLICSGYRNLARQTTNFENSLRSYAGGRYNFATAYKLTSGYIAVPGTSEHHTGLAIDFVTPGYMYLDSGFEDTPAYKWLSENSYKYGFILRYPSEKSELTGINYEPWHFRFIGFEHAQKIYESGLCLEEYMEREKENYPDVKFNALGELIIPSEPLWYNLIKNAPETEKVTETETEIESEGESIESDSEETDIESDETEEDFPDWLKPVEDESDTDETDTDESDFDESDPDETDSDEIDSCESDTIFEDTDSTDFDTDSDTYTESDDTSEISDVETESVAETEESITETESEMTETDDTELVTESDSIAEINSESLDEEEV